MENARNKAILDGVAEAFVDAVLQFCKHPRLQYRWMDYIPEESKISTPFWSRLLAQIKAKLRTTPILWPRSRSTLQLVSQLKFTPANFQDSRGDPLVPDLVPEMYLNPNYAKLGRLPKLKWLGIDDMHIADCILRIGQDANSLFGSKMKSGTEDWHERIARLLLVPFENERHRNIIPSTDSSSRTLGHNYHGAGLLPKYQRHIGTVGSRFETGQW